MTEFLQGYMPVLSSKWGHLGDELNGWVHILMLLLMLGWGVFFIYCLFRFSKKNNPNASYHGVTNHYSSYVEYGIVAFEALLLIGFAIPLLAFIFLTIFALVSVPDILTLKGIAISLISFL